MVPKVNTLAHEGCVCVAPYIIQCGAYNPKENNKSKQQNQKRNEKKSSKSHMQAFNFHLSIHTWQTDNKR